MESRLHQVVARIWASSAAKERPHVCRESVINAIKDLVDLGLGRHPFVAEEELPDRGPALPGLGPAPKRS